MFEILIVGITITFVVLLFKVMDHSTTRFNRRQKAQQELERKRQYEIKRHERALGLTQTGSDMATALRNSPVGPHDFRVEDVDWVVALGLNTTCWRLVDSDDGSVSVTDDVGIAIDNLDWGCKVVPVKGKDV